MQSRCSTCAAASPTLCAVCVKLTQGSAARGSSAPLQWLPVQCFAWNAVHWTRSYFSWTMNWTNQFSYGECDCLSLLLTFTLIFLNHHHFRPSGEIPGESEYVCVCVCVCSQTGSVTNILGLQCRLQNTKSISSRCLKQGYDGGGGGGNHCILPLLYGGLPTCYCLTFKSLSQIHHHFFLSINNTDQLFL